MAVHSNYRILSEKALHHSADPSLIAYCPSMDLVALVTTDQQVLIYRLNGQRVYGATQRLERLRVASIRWKPNGQLLAIAWSDGSIRLIGPESSRVVHHFSAGTNISDVTCMAWSANATNRSTSLLEQKKAEVSWSSFIATGRDHAVLDLPRDLSLIDIETSLPKLSILAAGPDEVFSSRSSLDALFQPFDPRDNSSVDVMVVGTKEGTIHLSIYDSFVIGSFTAPLLPGTDTSELVLHASHNHYSTHSLLLRAPAGKRLYLVPMDLRFISASSEYLSLLASRSTALQNLLRYINQVKSQIITEWKSTQELPSRFLGSINETLAAQQNRDIVQALYHSVATGHTIPAVREWLVDELSERGHKRWDKAVTTGLENLRRLVHENMLPAIERCSLILSRFLGIAKFQGANGSLGFTTQQINTILDSIACLHLVSSKILIQVVDELDLFASFSSWLRHEIDRLASEGSNSPSDDAAAEKEASIDHSKVLSYIQTAMTSSPLAIYFEDSSEEFNGKLNHAEQGMPMYELLDKQLQKQEQGLPSMKSLPRVDVLCRLLTGQANTIFSQIAEAEKRNVLFGKARDIGSAEVNAPMDMKMVAVENKSCETYIAFVPNGDRDMLQITRVKLIVENGISSIQNVSTASLQLGNGFVQDLKFKNDRELLVLWASKRTTNLLNVVYRHDSHTIPADGNETLPWFTQTHKSRELSPAIYTDQEILHRLSIQEFRSDDSFIPEKLEVRENSATESQRILLLSKDRLRYRVLEAMQGKMDVAGQEDILMA